MKKANSILGECVGLWLAEGDTKTEREITFTNSEISLVIHFHQYLSNLFSNLAHRVRVYIYSADGSGADQITFCKNVRQYIDKRASRPYYIWRLGSVDSIRKWRKIVEHCKLSPSLYPDILRGIFAGEGNVKNHGTCRTVRISQHHWPFLEIMLGYLGISYSYRLQGLSYCISHQDNLDILKKHEITLLHQSKHSEFMKMHGQLKQRHYRDGVLKKSVFAALAEPITTRELSVLFRRSAARISDVLIELRKDGLVRFRKAGSSTYWVNAAFKYKIISMRKAEYLLVIQDSMLRSIDVARKLNVCQRSAGKRLQELERIGLIMRNNDKTWQMISSWNNIWII